MKLKNCHRVDDPDDPEDETVLQDSQAVLVCTEGCTLDTDSPDVDWCIWGAADSDQCAILLASHSDADELEKRSSGRQLWWHTGQYQYWLLNDEPAAILHAMASLRTPWEARLAVAREWLLEP